MLQNVSEQDLVLSFRIREDAPGKDSKVSGKSPKGAPDWTLVLECLRKGLQTGLCRFWQVLQRVAERHFVVSHPPPNRSPRWTPETQRQFLTWLGSARHFTGGKQLTERLRDIRVDFLKLLSDKQQQEFSQEIAALDKPLEVEEMVPARPVVKDWQLTDLEPHLASVTQNRSFKNARQALLAANCLKCHRIGSTGAQIGPDLAAKFIVDDRLQGRARRIHGPARLVTPGKAGAKGNAEIPGDVQLTGQRCIGVEEIVRGLPAMEAGAKAGLIAPDQTTFDYLKGRTHAPAGAQWDAAVADWSTLFSDDDEREQRGRRGDAVPGLADDHADRLDDRTNTNLCSGRTVEACITLLFGSPFSLSCSRSRAAMTTPPTPTPARTPRRWMRPRPRANGSRSCAARR